MKQIIIRSEFRCTKEDSFTEIAFRTSFVWEGIEVELRDGIWDSRIHKGEQENFPNYYHEFITQEIRDHPLSQGWAY